MCWHVWTKCISGDFSLFYTTQFPDNGKVGITRTFANDTAVIDIDKYFSMSTDLTPCAISLPVETRRKLSIVSKYGVAFSFYNYYL